MSFDDFAKLNVSRETFLKLEEYVLLLTKWNKAINLTSDIDNIWHRHILDCAQLIKYLPDHNHIIADIGSGAGLPGIVLSLLGIKHVKLIEPDLRKCTFLYQAAKISNNKIDIINKRWQDVGTLEFDILTSRGLTKIEQILELVMPHYREQKILLFKGRNWQQELSLKNWHYDYKIYESLTAQDSIIIEITNLKKL